MNIPFVLQDSTQKDFVIFCTDLGEKKRKEKKKGRYLDVSRVNKYPC